MNLKNNLAKNLEIGDWIIIDGLPYKIFHKMQTNKNGVPIKGQYYLFLVFNYTELEWKIPIYHGDSLVKVMENVQENR